MAHNADWYSFARVDNSPLTWQLKYKDYSSSIYVDAWFNHAAIKIVLKYFKDNNINAYSQLNYNHYISDDNPSHLVFISFKDEADEAEFILRYTSDRQSILDFDV